MPCLAQRHGPTPTEASEAPPIIGAMIDGATCSVVQRKRPAVARWSPER